MIVKMDGKDPYMLFEATGEGVATYFLNSALKTYLDSDLIGFRRLAIERTNEMRDSLKSFVEGKQITGKVLHPSCQIKERLILIC